MTPLLVGCLVVGASFVAAALDSQLDVKVDESLVAGAIVGGADEWSSVTPTQRRAKQHSRAPRVLPRSVPVGIDIAAIDVRSELHEVGLAADGSIETPSGALYDQAAWYRHSPAPGSRGPAIILGHVDSAANGPSIFFRLGELARGDRIVVTRKDGSDATFVVDAVKRYAKDDFPTELVYGDLDHAGLRLVTCGGEFDEVAGHYRDNIVVFATLST